MSINSYFSEKCSIFQAHALYGSDGLTDEGKKARCIMIAKAVGGAALIALGLAIIGIGFTLINKAMWQARVFFNLVGGTLMIGALLLLPIIIGGGALIKPLFEPVSEEKRSVYFQIPSAKQATARPLPDYLSLDYDSKKVK